MSRFIGNVSAYAYAVEKGYTGTEEEFAELMASYATVGQTAVEAAQTATTKASEASQSATTATNKASEATTAAQTAINKSAEAQSNAQTASTKASEATTAATAAQTAKTQTEAAASQALTDISTARTAAISAVQTEGATQTANATAQAQAAATSATTASTKASEASASATTATTKATEAAVSATSAANAASAAQGVLESIPEDYSDLSEDVDQLKADLGDLLVTGKNLFNKDDVVIGKYINVANGAEATLDSSSASNYIEIKPNTSYIISVASESNSIRYAIYDSLKTYIVGRKSDEAFTTPSNAKYIRFSINNSAGIDSVQLEKGDTKSDYVPYEKFVSSKYIRLDELKSDILPVRPKDTTFFHVSKNHADPATTVSGEYVNQGNGNFAANASYNRTDYVPVSGGNTCLIKSANSGNPQIRYAFYTSQKVYISGGFISGASYYLIDVPDNAAYIALSAVPYYFPFMVAMSDADIPFEEYGIAYILSQYIQTDISDAILNLPSKIYATTGIELNIYFDSLTENWNEYSWNVDCAKGRQVERGYQITPTDADAGTYPITITISLKDNLSISKSVTADLIITSASAGSGTTKSVIVLGDSTTDNGTVIVKLHENFADDAMSVTTLGTRGTAPNNMEGRSGWSLTTYFTREYVEYADDRGTIYNPFYNPTTQTFDASYYFTNSGVSVPDYFIINMGINDVFGSTNDAALSTVIEQVVGYVDSIITSLKAVSQTLKICICCTIPPNHSQDAFGKAYACSQTRNRYKRNNTMLVERLIDEYDGRESEEIYLIPIHTNLDTVYNMGMETLPVNARNTDVTYQSPIANGGVHPVASGYWQIADVYTAFIKANA